jgi:hypothetical protein
MADKNQAAVGLRLAFLQFGDGNLGDVMAVRRMRSVLRPNSRATSEMRREGWPLGTAVL